MTVPTSHSRVQYDGNDAATEFDYTFKIFDADDLVVVLTDSDDNETTLVRGSDYNVDGVGDEAGGTVTYPISGTPLATGETLTILREIPVVQETDLRNQGRFYPETIEDELDRSRMIDQQQQEELGRTLKKTQGGDHYDASGARIENLGDAIDPQDALTKGQSDARFASDVITKVSGAWDGKGLQARNFTVRTPVQDGDLPNMGAVKAYIASIESGEVGDATSVTARDTNQTQTLADWTREVFNLTGIDVRDRVHVRPSYDPDSSTPRVLLDGSTTPSFGHRHFGGIAMTASGRLFIVYRKSSEHAVNDSSQIVYIYSDDGGDNWSSENVLVDAIAGRDQRDPSIGVSETNRLFIAWCDIDAAGSASASNPNLYKLRYSDDEGGVFSDDILVDSVDFDYSRTFGSVKLVPSDDSSYSRMLVLTAYQQTGESPSTFAAVYYRSYDNGETWSAPVFIVDSTDGYNETDVAWVSPGYAIAATRFTGGMTIFVTEDNGSTWTNKGVIPDDNGDSDVAPTMDVFAVDGEPYALLGFCNRAADLTSWRTARVSDVFSATGGAAFEAITTTGAADMVNASGYQNTLFYPNGEMAFVEFKEFTGGDPWSEVRFWRGFPQKWVFRRFTEKLLLGVDSPYSVDGFTHTVVASASEPAHVTNVNTASPRNHYALLESNVLAGFLGTDNQKLLIGGASGVQLDTTSPFYIGAASSSSDALVYGAVASSATGVMTTESPGTSSARQHFRFRNVNGQVGSISTSGTSTSYATSSDPRLKTPFEGVSDSEVEALLSNLANCTGRFAFLGDPETKVLGFDAHKILDLPFGSEIGVEGEGPRDSDIGEVYGHDLDGNPLRVTPAAVDQSKAVPALVLAVEMLIRRVRELEGG